MDNHEPTGISLDGAAFRKAISDAVETSARRTLEGIREALNNSHNAFLEASPDATEEEKADSAVATKLRFVQYQYCVSDVLINFVEEFAENLTKLSQPSSGVISATTGQEPLDVLSEPIPHGEPSWKKLHEMIGFKS